MSTIVVIEQDIAMRTLFCEWLEAEGHRVIGRGGAPAEVVSGIDLVIVDLPNLPTRGAEAVSQVKTAYPAAALVGSSTQLSRPLSAGSMHARALGVSALVTKPCSRTELLRAVVDATDVAR